ncbi:AI-2E family transporter [Parvibaculum sp.]|uniref:AI-2E family transporter n=1 Tax=Parvibaculum sp. TaxID=2024848 RepID=UPI002731967F|nr:AI-2E family transporter [Parvibaculum sp.]MDP1627820.1 AI-2E family transporter [Parvibaculum sp.]MDP2150818.1 AI-2E family transporter [Parvibaculum sp.]MDP3327637.1 AI-2E family transporter [Parvibaculum sp.]
MSIQRQTIIWAVVIATFILLLWLLKGILLPFVAGMAIAYFLDPLADRLESYGLSRLAATATITVFFLLIAVVLMIVLVPVLYNQSIALVEIFPSLMQRGQEWLLTVGDGVIGRLLGVEGQDVEQAIKQSLGGSLDWLVNLLTSVGSQGLQIVGLISLIVVTPVVAFYLLLDWDRMVERVDTLLPRDHAETIRRLSREINEVLAGFIRGQVIVCLVLGTIYAVGLTLVGLKFGLIVGIVAGIISFIPYLGTILGFIVGIALALFQFGTDFVQVGLVIGVFAIGQFIEGNFLSPKLVGDRVKLHPVWVMFAIFAFAALFGFVGALLALPVAAALGVLARFATGQYRKSQLYLGSSPGNIIPPRDTDS